MKNESEIQTGEQLKIETVRRVRELVDWLHSQDVAGCIVGDMGPGRPETFEFQYDREPLANVIHCFLREYGSIYLVGERCAPFIDGERIRPRSTLWRAVTNGIGQSNATLDRARAESVIGLCGGILQRSDDDGATWVTPFDVPRCKICDWPLVAGRKDGCTAESCSYRPPEGSSEYIRIKMREERFRSRGTTEVPTCAAIRTTDGIQVAGKRHHDCLAIMKQLVDGNGMVRDRNTEVHGFMTSFGRFVDREEAFRLFVAAGLTSADPGGFRGTGLFSEDLY